MFSDVLSAGLFITGSNLKKEDAAKSVCFLLFLRFVWNEEARTSLYVCERVPASKMVGNPMP